MKIKTTAKAIKSALSTAARVAKRTENVLTNYGLISASDGEFRVSTTDLRTNLSCLAVDGIEIIESGEIVTQVKLLRDLVNTFGDDQEIQLSTKKDKLVVKYGDKKEATLSTVDPGDFPEIVSAMPEIEPVVINVPQLKSAITRVLIANSIDEARQALQYIEWTFEGEVLRLIGVDGFKLDREILPISGSMSECVLVHGESMKELKDTLSGDTVKCVVNGNKIYFEFENTIIALGLGGLTFIRFDDALISDKFEVDLRLEAKPVLNILKRMEIYTDDNIVQIEIENNRMNFSTTGTQAGEIEDHLELGSQFNGNFRTGINCLNMIMILSQVSGSFRFAIQAENKPIQIEQNGFTFISMPMYKNVGTNKKNEVKEDE